MSPPDAPGTRARGLTLEQSAVLAALVGMAGLCWWWLIYSAQLVDASPTDSAGMAGMAGMAPELPSVAYFASAFLMWALMMVAMMVPSASPTVLLYMRFSARASPQRERLNGLLFALSYLLVWIGFSAVAAGIQTWFVKNDVIGQMALALGSEKFAAFLLALSALYQLSPSKRACLAQCRAPSSYLADSWRPGIWGAIRLGLGHGLHCLGCCWLLILLLFVGGVMNLLWAALLTLVISIEKLAPASFQFEKWLAGLMVVAAIGVLLL